MKDEHYTDVKIYKIYAILLDAEEPFCYIGKTTSQRLSAAYHRHRRGEVAATEGFLSQKDEQPQLYLLEELPMTNARAHKRVLAWIHIFMTNGYSLINHSGSVKQAKNLKPDTERMVEELQKEPLEKILQRTILMHPADADTKPEPYGLPLREDKKCTLSVRLKESEKQQFLRFCKRKKITQKQGFSLLLDYAENDGNTKQLHAILAEKDAQIYKLKQENKLIQTRKVMQEVKKGIEDHTSFLKEGLKQYLGELFASDIKTEPLKVISYRRYMREKEPSIEYVYPETDGFMCIKLEALLWGMSRKRALFVLGITENGSHIRLRYYPKDEFLGYPLYGCPYAYKGARWFVGFRQSKDGAMNLVAAFPLEKTNVKNTNCVETIEPESWDQKATLDDQIKCAQTRRG